MIFYYLPLLQGHQFGWTGLEIYIRVPAVSIALLPFPAFLFFHINIAGDPFSSLKRR